MMYPTFVIFIVRTRRSFTDSLGSISVLKYSEGPHLATAGNLVQASPPTVPQQDNKPLTRDITGVVVEDQVMWKTTGGRRKTL